VLIKQLDDVVHGSAVAFTTLALPRQPGRDVSPRHYSVARGRRTFRGPHRMLAVNVQGPVEGMPDELPLLAATADLVLKQDGCGLTSNEPIDDGLATDVQVARRHAAQRGDAHHSGTRGRQSAVRGLRLDYFHLSELANPTHLGDETLDHRLRAAGENTKHERVGQPVLRSDTSLPLNQPGLTSPGRPPVRGTPATSQSSPSELGQPISPQKSASTRASDRFVCMGPEFQIRAFHSSDGRGLLRCARSAEATATPR
jgi:hypothetical protein